MDRNFLELELESARRSLYTAMDEPDSMEKIGRVAFWRDLVAELRYLLGET